MTPYHFCKHQKESEVTRTPICSIYGREYECPYVRSYNADYMCKQYVPYRSIGDRLNKVEERLDTLERMITRLDRKLTHYIDIEILCKNPNKEE